MSTSPAILYTLTDEAPALATRSFLPILRAFARNTSARIALPILLWDERLTTAEAERALIAADASRAKRADVIDQVAAGIILQNVLDALANQQASTL